MVEAPLQVGVRQLLRAVRREEWTYHRALSSEERERAGSDGAPEIKELVAQASAARRDATRLLRSSETKAATTGDWAAVHHDAHEAMTALHEALDTLDEERLAAPPGPRHSHPQYLWRDVTNLAVRGPFLSYADWHRRAGRSFEALAVLSRWYEAVRGTDLPTKALSDVSYDLACGLARAGRADDAMTYLPDAFTYNDRAAVGVLQAWARQDAELAALGGRPDFRTLVGETSSR